MKKIFYSIGYLLLIFITFSCSEDALTLPNNDAEFSAKAGNNNPDIVNYYDIDGSLCTGNWGDQEVGTPLELWMGVGKQHAGTKVGEVRFDNDCVIIDLTKGDGVYDLTSIHMDFVNDYNNFPQTKKGNPKNGKFEYNFDTSSKLDGIRIAPSVYKICGVDLDKNLGAIHVDAIPGKSVTTTADFLGLIPTNTVTMNIQNYFPPYVDADDIGGADKDRPAYTILNIANAGDLSGTYMGWCLDYHSEIARDFDYGATMYSFYETLPTELTSRISSENFNKINYLLNTYKDGDYIQKTNDDCSPDGNNQIKVTSSNIQQAIWWYLEGEILGSRFFGPLTKGGTQALICDADNYGSSFVPSECGDLMLFIVVPKDSNGDLKQSVIGAYPISCAGMGSGTAWADGKYGIGFTGNNWATYFGMGCTYEPE